jgi:hypothetical protein
MKSVFKLSDEDLESCVDGTTNIDLLWEIIHKPGVVVNGVVNPDQFASWFASAIEGYTDAETLEEFEEANKNNLEWGFAIADNINDLISG